MEALANFCSGTFVMRIKFNELIIAVTIMPEIININFT